MNLDNLNLVELNAQEIQEVDGGVKPPSFWAVYGLYLLVEAAGSPKAHYDAFMKGFNSAY